MKKILILPICVFFIAAAAPKNVKKMISDSWVISVADCKVYMLPIDKIIRANITCKKSDHRIMALGYGLAKKGITSWCTISEKEGIFEVRLEGC